MRSLILGAGGMLGRALLEEGERRGLESRGLTHGELDLRDTDEVARHLDDFEPDLLINAAAYTDVDGCETERALALEVNGEAVGRLAALAAERDRVLVHVSSDYVFDGRASAPYSEEAATAPVSVYGESKLLGEQLALERPSSLVVRASWLFGPGGRNFAATIARLSHEQHELRVVDDQLGCPTYTPYLASALFDLARLGARGVVHYRNSEPVSWFGFAAAVVEIVGASARLVPVPTEAFPRPAVRPAYSVLGVERFEGLVGRPVKSWHEGLRDYLPKLLVEAGIAAEGGAP